MWPRPPYPPNWKSGTTDQKITENQGHLPKIRDTGFSLILWQKTILERLHCQKWLTSFRSSIDLFIKNEQEDASTLHLITSAAILPSWWEKIPKKSWKNRWNRSFLMLELSKMAPPSCFPFTWREATLSKSLLTIIYRNKLAIPSAANTFFSGTRSPKSGTPGHSFQNRKNPGHVPENRDGREVCI